MRLIFQFSTYMTPTLKTTLATFDNPFENLSDKAFVKKLLSCA